MTQTPPFKPMLSRHEMIAARFRIESLIAVGGMGEVYEATQMPIGRRVALKILRAEPDQGDTACAKRFAQEAALLTNLYHPNTVSILDVGEHAERPFIVMEYIDGEALPDALERLGKLPPKAAVKIATQIAASLAEAHAQGIIHRDIKSDNIVVQWLDDEEPFARVLDFGIAQAQDNAGMDVRRWTKPGSICGTTEYMSPEHARGDTLDARSDLYSLGVVLYEMLTGTLPFAGDNPVKLAMMHQTTPVPELPASIPAPIAACALEALSKSPEDRPESAEAFREMLGSALAVLATGPMPILARQSITLPPQLQNPVVARTTLILALLALVTLVSIGVISVIGA